MSTPSLESISTAAPSTESPSTESNAVPLTTPKAPPLLRICMPVSVNAAIGAPLQPALDLVLGKPNYFNYAETDAEGKAFLFAALYEKTRGDDYAKRLAERNDPESYTKEVRGVTVPAAQPEESKDTLEVYEAYGVPTRTVVAVGADGSPTKYTIVEGHEEIIADMVDGYRVRQLQVATRGLQLPASRAAAPSPLLRNVAMLYRVAYVRMALRGGDAWVPFMEPQAFGATAFNAATLAAALGGVSFSL